ncbi:MAG: CHAD domain-containing protein [Phreatobacter sp.]
MRQEVELKLLAPPGTLDRLRTAPVIVEHIGNQGTVRRLEAVYYDTPDRLLDRHGLSLRVRRNGKRYLQTLKQRVSGNGTLSRREWEAPVDTIEPDLTRLPIAEIGAPLDGLLADALAPMFTTKVRRRLQKVELSGAIVEIAFDEGTIEAERKSEPLSEVELELKAGDVGVLYELGLALLDIAPVRVAIASKAERGYALACDTAPAAAKAGPAGINAEDNADEAIAKLLGNCHHHLMANLAATESGRDPEGVHQMRVALRRLRTAMSILRCEMGAHSFEATALEAKLLARSLGPARGWDVFLAETLAEIDNASLPDIDLAALRDTAEPFRARSYAAVRGALADPRANRFLLSLGRLIERRSWRNDVTSEALAILAEPASILARRALTRIHRKAVKQGRHFRELAPEARHKLRLTLKKLRYATEFFLPLYDEPVSARRYLKRLTRLQNALGAANDVTTTRPLLHDIAQATTAPDVQRAVGAVTGWQHCQQSGAAAALWKSWRGFQQATPFWSR